MFEVSRVDIGAVADRESDRISTAVVDNYQLLQLFYRLETAVGKVLYSKKHKEAYSYIPYSHIAFYQDLKKEVKKLERKNVTDIKFLEVGSGLGTKLQIAYEWLNLNVSGIEIDPNYVKVAKEFCGLGVKIIKQDALKYKGYGKFDIIYTYQPMRDLSFHDKMIDVIKSQMKIGAVLLEAYCFDRNNLVRWVKK